MEGKHWKMDLSKISGGIWVMGSCSCWFSTLVSIPRTKMSDDTGVCGVGDSSCGAPDSSFGATDSSYCAPDSSFGAPDSSYCAPDSSFGAPDNSYQCDSRHNEPGPCDSTHISKDCHGTGQGSFNNDAGNISSNTPQWKNEDKYWMDNQTKNAEGQKLICCCNLIWSELWSISWVWYTNSCALV